MLKKKKNYKFRLKRLHERDFKKKKIEEAKVDEVNHSTIRAASTRKQKNRERETFEALATPMSTS